MAIDICHINLRQRRVVCHSKKDVIAIELCWEARANGPKKREKKKKKRKETEKALITAEDVKASKRTRSADDAEPKKKK